MFPGSGAGPLIGVSFAPNNLRLITTGSAAVVEIWDILNRRLLHSISLRPFPADVAAAIPAPDGRHLITANPNGTIYVLRLPEALGLGTVK